MFIQQVEEQLGRMSEADKDRWILSQAKLLEEDEQQGFLLSLSGEKKISYMPDNGEIRDFCQKVENGEIYLEYETHYFEFDDDGRYMDEWVVWHNDPFAAMDFLDKVFRGCHDLVILNEYKTAADILNRVCRLRLRVVESPKSDELKNRSPFTMEDIIRENMLAVNSSDIGEDWVTAVVRQKDGWDSQELAGVMADIFQEPVCRTMNPSILAGEKLPEQFFFHMKNILAEETRRAEAAFEDRSADGPETAAPENTAVRERLDRLRDLVRDIESNCLSGMPDNS